MAILKIRDSNGNVQEILAIKGDKGDKGADGTMTFEDLTDEQKESLKGEKGEKGDKGDKGDTGEKGADGTVSFDFLTPEQKASLKGDNYVLTSADKAEIANQVSTSAQVLPPVTEADDGKFLKVHNGAWCAIAISNAEGVTY